LEDTKGLLRSRKTIQWSVENGQNDKQRPTQDTHKTKDLVTRTTLKTKGELNCFRRVSKSCLTCDTRRVTVVTNPVINHY
jgi:hypothetical protein